MSYLLKSVMLLVTTTIVVMHSVPLSAGLRNAPDWFDYYEVLHEPILILGHQVQVLRFYDAESYHQTGKLEFGVLGPQRTFTPILAIRAEWESFKRGNVKITIPNPYGTREVYYITAAGELIEGDFNAHKKVTGVDPLQREERYWLNEGPYERSGTFVKLPEPIALKAGASMQQADALMFITDTYKYANRHFVIRFGTVNSNGEWVDSTVFAEGSWSQVRDTPNIIEIGQMNANGYTPPEKKMYFNRKTGQVKLYGEQDWKQVQGLSVTKQEYRLAPGANGPRCQRDIENLLPQT